MKKLILLYFIIGMLLIFQTAGADPTPSSYCADNFTLVTTTPQFVYNGTIGSTINVTSINPCPVSEICQNNTFFGPACTAPIYQSGLWSMVTLLLIYASFPMMIWAFKSSKVPSPITAIISLVFLVFMESFSLSFIPDQNFFNSAFLPVAFILDFTLIGLPLTWIISLYTIYK